MATIADYTGQIGVMLRGHFYFLEDVLEQQPKEIEKNGKSIKEVIAGFDQARAYTDQAAHQHQQADTSANGSIRSPT
eukprot:15062180-Heterocapsa_arctica.AAC.1